MKASARKQDDQAVPPWQTIYSSLILIMLMLFVMLVSYSAVDNEKAQDLKRTFNSAGESYAKAAGSLKKAARESGLEEGITLQQTSRGLMITLKDRLLFATGSSNLNKAFLPYLDKVISIAKKYDFSLLVEGHTDDIPIRNNTFSSNWELSTARAIRVLRYCMEEGRLPLERLRAAGYGPYHPIGPNNSTEARMQNRRIELFLAKAI